MLEDHASNARCEFAHWQSRQVQLLLLALAGIGNVPLGHRTSLNDASLAGPEAHRLPVHISTQQQGTHTPRSSRAHVGARVDSHRSTRVRAKRPTPGTAAGGVNAPQTVHAGKRNGRVQVVALGAGQGIVGRRRYTDDERATYVAMLAAEGYPERLGALKKVSGFVGCHPNVLRRWWKGSQNPPPTELVTEKRREIVDHLNDLIYQVLGLLPDSLDEASARELVTALGVFVDKRQLLTGAATQRSELTGKSGGALVFAINGLVDDDRNAGD